MSIKITYNLFLLCFLFLFTSFVYSQGMMDTTRGWGMVAANVTNNFTALTRLVTAGSYIGGIAFFIAAIMKFKQHKDNPTQIPLGTPIALVLIAGTLVFFPAILSTLGFTAFSDGGSVAGPTGVIFSIQN